MPHVPLMDPEINWYDVRAALVRYKPCGGEHVGLFDTAIELCERMALDKYPSFGSEIEAAEQHGYERGRGELLRWEIRVKALEARLERVVAAAEGRL